ncbi:MAG: ShlB/FhaC/HecB family hemolysin secretion/activation protein [Steroidobacteraceae bacterium]|nr:ShlB/FhaC/HecB family hemolysin secretion/activation protein [Steroidobacteraceae bacterium]
MTYRITVLAAALIAAHPAWTQQQPDAGQVLQQTRPPTLPAPRPTPEVSVQAPPETTALHDGASVTLTRVKFSGNTVFSEAELRSVLGEVKDSHYDLAGLQGLARRITEHYRAAGYPFARAVIPAQRVADGVLLIEIIEGRYGKVAARGDLAEAADGYLAHLAPGAVIESSSLDRALLILADQPGVKVAPILRPGRDAGTGDLVVEVSRERMVKGEAGADNYGNRYTGQYRTKAVIQSDSPFMLGDQFRLQLLYTDEDLWLGSLSYGMPLKKSGLRARLDYSHTYYELGKDFADLKAHGTAKVASLGLSYPLIRSRNINLVVGLAYQTKDLADRQDAVSVRNTKRSDLIPVTLQFDRRDTWGMTYGQAVYTVGRLKLDAALTAADIASNTGTRGNFGKWNFDIARLNSTPIANLTLFGRASLQWAGGNLDSSESFILGGARGVRAYPEGEGNGDEGWFVQIEGRYRVGSAEPYLFFDAGSVKINADPARIIPAITDNTRSIAGAGLGLRYADRGWNVDAALAWRTKGGAPESDTRDDKPWLSVSGGYRF